MGIGILDLFAGAGGFSLGFEMVKDQNGKSAFELHRAVEIDKYACKTLRRHYGNEKVIEGDLTDRAIHKRVIQECRNKISVVIGGIPCQSFSLIGPRSGYGKNMEKFKRDERDHLYMYFRDIVKALNPEVIIIENVKGILSKSFKGKSKIIERIILDLESLGYNFTNGKDGKKFILLNAADFGVPQFRERVVLMGAKKRSYKGDITYIEPTHYNQFSKTISQTIRNDLYRLCKNFCVNGIHFSNRRYPFSESYG